MTNETNDIRVTPAQIANMRLYCDDGKQFRGRLDRDCELCGKADRFHHVGKCEQINAELVDAIKRHMNDWYEYTRDGLDILADSCLDEVDAIVTSLRA